jgi:hypothetical protein
VTDEATKANIAFLSPLTQSALAPAFSRAAKEGRFFPAPALLRDFSGHPVSGDPIAAEAREALLAILTAMRKGHGPKLKDKLAGALRQRERSAE